MQNEKLNTMAAQWLTDLETSENIDNLWPAFQAWLAEDPRNRQAFLKMEDAARRMDSLWGLRLIANEEDSNFPSVETDGPPRRLQWGLPVPALWSMAVAILVALVLPLLFHWWTDFAWESYETPLGRHELHGLSDGSWIELNTNTQLRVRLKGEKREVELMRGEALFRVSHDSRPFVVSAGDTTVSDLGTEFAVRRRGDDSVEVLVRSGRVEVVSNESNSTKREALKGGQAAIVGSQNIRVDNLDEATIERRLAWQMGKVSFAGETLGEAAEDVNRYNQTKIVIDDPSIANLHIGGVFPATDPEAFVAILEQTFRIQSSGSRDGVIRLTRGPGS